MIPYDQIPDETFASGVLGTGVGVEPTDELVVAPCDGVISSVAEMAGLSKKDTEKVLKAFTDTVTEELRQGGKVQMVGFGTFEVSERAARDGRNPRTGEPMPIEASRTPKFRAGKALKDAINK